MVNYFSGSFNYFGCIFKIVFRRTLSQRRNCGIGAWRRYGILGNYLFEREKDVKKLYVAVLLIFLPFIIYFLIVAHERFGGFFKAFGMMGGLTLIAFLEEKSEPLSYDVPWWKKLIRIVIGVALAFVLKEGLKIFEMGEVHVDLVVDTLRYFAVVLAVGYLCPLLFKKIKI